MVIVALKLATLEYRPRERLRASEWRLTGPMTMSKKNAKNFDDDYGANQDDEYEDDYRDDYNDDYNDHHNDNDDYRRTF